MNPDYQPRYVIFARQQGNTPEQQLERDESRWPGGLMCGFILWISGQRQAFIRECPEKMIGDVIADQSAFTAFCEKNVVVIS